MGWFFAATLIAVVAGLGMARLEMWAEERDKKDKAELMRRLTEGL